MGARQSSLAGRPVTREQALRWGLGDHTRIATSAIPAAVLALVDERMGGRYCDACGRGVQLPPGEPLEIDHRQPLSRGGDNHHLNLRWLCRGHNRGRGARKHPPARARWQRARGT